MSFQAKLIPATGSGESGNRAYRCEAVKQRVYFLRWGTTTEISFTSKSTGTFPLAAAAFDGAE